MAVSVRDEVFETPVVRCTELDRDLHEDMFRAPGLGEVICLGSGLKVGQNGICRIITVRWYFNPRFAAEQYCVRRDETEEAGSQRFIHDDLIVTRSLRLYGFQPSRRSDLQTLARDENDPSLTWIRTQRFDGSSDVDLARAEGFDVD
ncbi:MAG: hypothetical protein ACK56I_33490, partial [bacterium]